MIVRMCDVCQNKIPNGQKAYQLSLYDPINSDKYDISYSEVCEHCAQQIHSYLRKLGEKEVK